MPVPIPIVVYGSCCVFVTFVAGGKIVLDASHRKTVKVETDSCCRMKDAGFSEEMIVERAKSWEQNRSENGAFLRTVVEGAATVENAIRAMNPKNLADIKTMKSGSWNSRNT